MSKKKGKEDSIHLNTIKSFSVHEQYSYFDKLVGHNSLTEEHKLLTPTERKVLEKANEKLDKYYTKQSVANDCYIKMRNLILKSHKPDHHLLFLEPSAGSGVFLNAIVEEKLGFDIAPTNDKQRDNRKHIYEVHKNDFLKDDLTIYLTEEQKKKQWVFIGNPPFGTKASLAIEFVNKSLSYSNIVGFIVPLQFRKWSVQSKIIKGAKLIMDLDLQENAFEFMGKDYKVRCCFQVWAMESFTPNFNDIYQDLRIASKPDVDHEKFKMYQFNRTVEAEKFFDYEWDFAVPRQGYLDYSFKAFHKDECDRKKQWIFFKANDEQTLKNLMNLDFVKLSKKNIGTPGFGKADVVKEYRENFK